MSYETIWALTCILMWGWVLLILSLSIWQEYIDIKNKKGG